MLFFMEQKTQLQLRIENMVRYNKTFPKDTYFLNTNNYSQRNLLDKDTLIGKLGLLFEEDLKIANTYNEILPSIKARLSLMEYEKNLTNILENNQNNLVKKVKIMGLIIKNERLKNQAIKKTIQRKGGLIKLIAEKSFYLNIPSFNLV